MIATRSPEGARLLDDEALAAMRELCALATVVTPNINEAEALLACKIRDQKDQREAALALVARGARAAVVKGGHLPGPQVVDALAVGDQVTLLRVARRQKAEFHGGGCLFAALIAGRLAMAPAPQKAEAIGCAVADAKRLLTRAILRPSTWATGCWCRWFRRAEVRDTRGPCKTERWASWGRATWPGR